MYLLYLKQKISDISIQKTSQHIVVSKSIVFYRLRMYVRDKTQPKRNKPEQ